MKKPYPYLSDWLVISWRWLALFLLILSFWMQGSFDLLRTALLVLIALWNLAMSAMAIINVRMPAHRLINLFCDFAFSGALFVAGGGITGSLVWIGVVVIVNAAIFYQWRGAFVLALIFSAGQVGYTIALNPENLYAWIPFAVVLALNLGIATAAGLGSMLIFKHTQELDVTTDKELLAIEVRANQQYQKRMNSLSSLVETLSSSLDYTVVLDTMLDLSQSAMDIIDSNSEKMTSAVLLFEESKLIVANSRRFSPTDITIKFPGEKGLLAETLKKVETQMIRNPAGDPELWKVNALQNCKVAVSYPLSRGIDDYGIMLFGHPSEDYFSEEKVEALNLISRQAVIAIQNARLYQQVEEEKQAIITSQEEANKKLARDLHDGPIQSVASIAMRLSVAQRLLHHKPLEIEAELANIETLARDTTGVLRHMLFILRPLSLETDGLIAGLQSIADKNMNTYQQKVRLDVDEKVAEQLDPNKHSMVFYLVEEAVTNARKHAQADLILVRLKSSQADPDIAVLEIIDNGIGFDVKKVSQKYSQRDSLGMVNLNERTQLINGLLHIDSLPGKGSRICIFIPLSTAAIEKIQSGKIDLQKS